MKRYEKLDKVLKYLTTSDLEPKDPMKICCSAGLELDKEEAIKILEFLGTEGNVEVVLSETNGKPNKLDKYYYGNYKGSILIDNGGYKVIFHEFKRKKIATCISDYVDIIVKPLGILTAISLLFWTTIQIINFFQKQ